MGHMSCMVEINLVKERVKNMTAEEKQGLVDAVELAIDFNMDIAAEDIEVYEYIVANRGGKDGRGIE